MQLGDEFDILTKLYHALSGCMTKDYFFGIYTRLALDEVHIDLGTKLSCVDEHNPVFEGLFRTKGREQYDLSFCQSS